MPLAPPGPHATIAMGRSALLALSLLASAPRQCQSILPSAAVDVFDPTTGKTHTILASQASFGSYPPMTAEKNPARVVQLPPQGDELLCNEAQGKADYSGGSSGGKKRDGGDGDEEEQGGTNEGGTVILVPRGQCTFERKALSAQRLGASAVMVYGTLDSRYNLNTTQLGPNATDAEREAEERAKAEGKLCWGRECAFDDILWPGDKYDYDCDMASAEVHTSVMSFNPLPYNGVNDPKLSGTAKDGNLCALNSDDPAGFEGKCPSQRCLLTGETSTGPDGGTTMKACCAWDTHVWLYNDPGIPKETETVRIPALYVTMREGGDILSAVSAAAAGGSGAAVSAVMYARWKPEYNPSAGLIWALGVFVAALAAWLSAAEYREEGRRVVAQREIAEEMATELNKAGRDFASANGSGRRRSPSPPKNGEAPFEAEAQGQGGASAQQQNPNAPHLYRRETSAMSEEHMELNVYHALGFIVMASSALLILFFLKVYNIVKVMYGFGCSGALTQVLFYPLYSRIADAVGVRGRAERIAFTVNSCEIGPVSYIDVLSAASGYGLGFAWLAVAFLQVHPEESNFFWVVQDIMGACMCILFLNVIKLNSIRVASVLLLVAFFYDIFFVFVTPLLTKGAKSIMITVATSGGPPKADPSWCEKYPSDVDCQGGDPLPMLLTVPRVNDYAGGSSLLGLGDIVLPGLLLSFAARFDESKRLIGLIGGGNGVNRSNTCQTSPQSKSLFGGLFLGCCACLCNGGYFPPVVVSYAVGLLMANTAVYVMQMGQPALLYLVPCCLGTVMWLGWRRGELEELWNGPRVVRAADRLIYGEEEDEAAARQAILAGAGGRDGSGEYERVNSRGIEQRRLGTANDSSPGQEDGFDEEGGATHTGTMT
uniref:PA domain-containing protein n=1 Tax=Odontella aurita TaxID=265563 RepID=A0A7S4MHZ3_9STRA|mmetsp:Transcript_21919/g.64725  ORF Transcript_21919/g.64725 Transcript_21919/m.64725 type:complete len:883 (+) Transcript_21919:373-3021(+)